MTEGRSDTLRPRSDHEREWTPCDTGAYRKKGVTEPMHGDTYEGARSRASSFQLGKSRHGQTESGVRPRHRIGPSGSELIERSVSPGVLCRLTPSIFDAAGIPR